MDLLWDLHKSAARCVHSQKKEIIIYPCTLLDLKKVSWGLSWQTGNWSMKGDNHRDKYNKTWAVHPFIHYPNHFPRKVRGGAGVFCQNCNRKTVICNIKKCHPWHLFIQEPCIGLANLTALLKKPFVNQALEPHKHTVYLYWKISYQILNLFNFQALV